MTDDLLGDRILMCRLGLWQYQSSAKRMTQSDLAQAVSLVLAKRGINTHRFTKVSVSRWESGKTEPSLATISAIAEVCGCNRSLLAFGLDSNDPTQATS
jgi:transcriptional regulator with XRE-family HTH domain